MSWSMKTCLQSEVIQRKKIASFTTAMEAMNMFIETNYNPLLLEMIEKCKSWKWLSPLSRDGTMNWAQEIKLTKKYNSYLLTSTKLRRGQSRSMSYSMGKTNEELILSMWNAKHDFMKLSQRKYQTVQSLGNSIHKDPGLCWKSLLRSMGRELIPSLKTSMRNTGKNCKREWWQCSC